jgi:hypothetical protein
VTANRLRSLEPNLLALTGLRRLCIRQNLVSEAAEVEALASASGKLHELHCRLAPQLAVQVWPRNSLMPVYVRMQRPARMV